jgi:GTP pyrophosphokinase
VLDIFGKEKCNVVNAQTQVSRGTSWMSLTVEVSDAGRLARVLPQVAAMPGVRSARRR